MIAELSSGKIVSVRGDGKYVVEVQYDDKVRTDVITKLQNEINSRRLNDELIEAYTERESKRSIVESYYILLNSAIDDLASAIQTQNLQLIEEKRKIVKEVTESGFKARNEFQDSYTKYNSVAAKKAALVIRMVNLIRVGNEAKPLVECQSLDLYSQYTVNQLLPLYVLHYNCDREYFLPAFSIDINENGIFNLMTKYEQGHGFRYFNSALEPGFAMWHPILLDGILHTNAAEPSCLNNPTNPSEFYTFFDGKKSRFGKDTLFGSFKIPFHNNLPNTAGIDNGAEVICLISSIDPKNSLQPIRFGTINGVPFTGEKVVKDYTVSGSIVGYRKKPVNRGAAPLYFSWQIVEGPILQSYVYSAPLEEFPDDWIGRVITINLGGQLTLQKTECDILGLDYPLNITKSVTQIQLPAVDETFPPSFIVYKVVAQPWTQVCGYYRRYLSIQRKISGIDTEVANVPDIYHGYSHTISSSGNYHADLIGSDFPGYSGISKIRYAKEY